MSIKKINQKHFLVLGLVAIVAVIVVFNLPVDKVEAEDECTLSGWTWSGYGPNLSGIGWTSLTSDNQGDITPYGVTISDTGELVGYMWNGRLDSLGNLGGIGWIKLGGLSDFPPGNGTVAENAKLVGNNLTGWIRACSVFKNGCSGDLKLPTELGGWDGWISLSGITNDGNPYGVTYNSGTGNFGGYAWGGSKVVGWLDFSKVSYTTENCDSGEEEFQYTVSINPFILDTPSNGSLSREVVISTSQENPQEVAITNVTQPDGLEGVDISFPNLPKECTPDQTCSIDLLVEYDLTGDFTQTFALTVVTESEGIEKLTYPTVIISGKDDGFVCSASPDPAFSGQDVRWEAFPGGDLEVESYYWRGGGEDVNSQTGKTVLVSYDGNQIVNVKVDAVDENGEVVGSTDCSVQILPDIYFEQL